MTVLKQELKFQTRSILTWTGSVILTLIIFMAIYPGFAEEAELLRDAMAAYPKALMDTIGLDPELIFEASGFVSYIYGFLQVFLAIMGALYAFQVVAREKAAKMNDFLFVKPVARLSIAAQKVLCSLIAFLVINGVIFLMYRLMADLWTIGEKNMARIHEIILGSFLLQILFFAIASVIAVTVKKIKSPVGSATGLAFGFYLVLILGRLLEKDLIKKLTPFGYVEPLEITMNGLSGATIAWISLASLLLLALAAYIFHHRDLEVA